MAFEIHQTALPEVLELIPERFVDKRGFFSETFNQADLAKLDIVADWVQDNHSLSRDAGTLRGLHYQVPPMAQHKLVRVVRGAVLDVAVDIRQGSPRFGRHVAVTLSADRWNQLFVPEGFAHGYLTLEPMTEVVYKVTKYYSPEHERVVSYDDPAIGIDWQLDKLAPTLSARDAAAPPLQGQETGFSYQTKRVNA